MELILTFVCVASLITNLILVRRYTGNLKVEILPFEFIDTPRQETPVEPMAAPPENITIDQVEQVYSAWSNRSNIPWTETRRPSPEPIQKQQQGSDQRPYGWV